MGRTSRHTLEDWLTLIQGELSESPGLKFTPTEAAERWELDDPHMLGAILETLVISGRLHRDDDGYLVARSQPGLEP